MDTIPKNRILEFNQNTLEEAREESGLGSQTRINESLDILEEWIKKQSHFVKKDFPRDYLERTLLTSKGLIERAKQKMDKLCTFRTLMPEYFSDIKIEEFSVLKNVISHAHLPKLSKENHRIYMLKLYDQELTSDILHKYYRYIIMVSEYMKRSDYCTGFRLVVDFRDANIMSFVTKASPMELRQFLMILMEGYGMRLKGLHLITASRMIDALVGLCKQVLSAKLSGRMMVHKNLDTLFDILPKEIFPVEYGGNEIPLKELNEKWLEILDSQEYKEYYETMLDARTNESCRQTGNFNVEYAGMPGSFRALIVD